MKFTKQQEEDLLKINVAGKGVTDAEIAAALGWERKSQRFYDAVDGNDCPWEFKKQQSCQWIDPYKLSQLSKQEKNIGILFFMHKDGLITEVYETTYKKLIKKMGYSKGDLKAIRQVYKRECMTNRNTQMKAPIGFSEISTFKLIWKKE